jgi:hypothetical protein
MGVGQIESCTGVKFGTRGTDVPCLAYIHGTLRRVGPNCETRPNTSTENPYECRKVGSQFGPTLYSFRLGRVVSGYPTVALEKTAAEYARKPGVMRASCTALLFTVLEFDSYFHLGMHRKYPPLSPMRVPGYTIPMVPMHLARLAPTHVRTL